MGFFDIFKRTDINAGVEQYKATPKAILIDVRTPQEYREGHIPGSKNIPLQNIDKAAKAIRDKDAPLFVYCQSGGRSRQATGELENLGFTNVTNIGGFGSYAGKVAR